MASKLASLLPSNWNRYVEPMSGGAALFFYVLPARAVLSDLNDELINFYAVLRDRPVQLVRRLKTLRASHESYYALRSSKPRGRIQRAVRFAYLNRLAWNGLYRVNRRGEFNVPIGDRLPPVMWNESDLLNASAALRNAELHTADFRSSARCAAAGDFVFFDPPYPRGSRDQVGFNRYASDFFTVAHHDELARIITDMSRRSVYVMLTLANAEHLDRIYPRSLRRTRVRSKSLIACNSNDRRPVTELILTNY